MAMVPYISITIRRFMTSISNFGQNGQYKDYQGSDLVLAKNMANQLLL